MTKTELKRRRVAPHWRWHRAQQYLNVNKWPNREHEDRLVRRAHRFKKRMAVGNPLTAARLEREYPDIYRAFSIWDNNRNMAKWIIEAGIMANVTNDLIADYIAVETSVVQMYEKLFFDVRWASKRNPKTGTARHEGWLVSAVMSPSSTSGFLRGDPDQTWKAVALWGGWESLRTYITHGEMPPHVLDYFRTAVSSAKMKGQFVAANVDINGYNAVEFLQLGVQDRRLEKEFGGQAANAVEASVHGLLDAIHIEVTKQARVLPAEEPRLQDIPSASIFLEAQKAKELEAPKEKSDDDSA